MQNKFIFHEKHMNNCLEKADQGSMFEEEAEICHDRAQKKIEKFLKAFENTFLVKKENIKK